MLDQEDSSNLSNPAREAASPKEAPMVMFTPP